MIANSSRMRMSHQQDKIPARWNLTAADLLGGRIRFGSITSREACKSRIAALLLVDLPGCESGSSDFPGIRVTSDWLKKFNKKAKSVKGFTNDGQLCLDKIMSMLPEQDINSDCEELLYSYQCLESAVKGLAHYNKNKGDEFELVKVLHSGWVEDYEADREFLHANFLARSKKISSPPKLFFVEIESDDVVQCELAELTPFPSGGTSTNHVFHPSGFGPCSCNDEYAEGAIR